MNESLLKRTVLISLLWHGMTFVVFRVSAGDRFMALAPGGVYFRGAILDLRDIHPGVAPRTVKENGRARETAAPFLRSVGPEVPLLPVQTGKPHVSIPITPEKRTAQPGLAPAVLSLPRRDSTVTFYPRLPYHFLLYFKDRQTVHIELAFRRLSGQGLYALAIRRKVSSGNLEADLLTARYLSHYLFVQQADARGDEWKTVKVELSPKND